MKKGILFGAIVLATLVAGCGAEEPRYESVTELRDAAIAAGYECPSWVQSNNVKNASESGTCTDADVFAVYPSSEAVQETVDAAKASFGGVWLVGENWTINAPTVVLPNLQKVLGGTVEEL